MVKKLLKLKIRFFIFALLFLGEGSVYPNTTIVANSSFSLLNAKVVVNAINNTSNTYGEIITFTDNLSFVNYLWADTPTAKAGFKNVFQKVAVTILKEEGGNNKDESLKVDLVPTPICQNITVNLDNTGSVTIAENDVNNGSTGVGTLSFDTDITTFDCSDIGNIIVTLTVTDDNGSDTCTATVTVLDNQDPTIATLTGISVNADSGVCTYASSQLTAPSASDNCTTVTVTRSPASLVLGANTVTWTATDGSSNTATSTQIVTVLDNQDPTIIGTLITLSVEGCLASEVTAPVSSVASLEAFGLAISDNCTSDNNLIVFNSDAISGACPIKVTRTYTITDASGNASTVMHIINIADTTNPTASNPGSITVSGTAPAPDTTVVTDEADNCTAIPTVAFISDSSTGTCPQVVTRIYRVTDNCGNIKNVTQLITVTEIIAPIARCKANFTVQLNNVDGTATILPSDIDNGSTDNCGIASMSVSPNTFTCADIGNNSVTLTVTDIYGNWATCTSTVIVEAPTIDGGSLTGYLDTDIPANASDIIDVTSCPYDINTGTPAVNNAILNLEILPEFQDDILKWEFSINGGLDWDPIENTTLTHTYENITVTTLVRAVIEVGTCIEYSPRVILNVIPPHEKPTIVGSTTFTACLGTLVSVVAESQYGTPLGVNDGGLFNNANPAGWLVDGQPSLPAPGNNTNPTKWIETEGPKEFSGRCFDAADKKFAIAHGNIGYATTLETPIFNTLGLSTAILQFDQAYNLNAGSWCLIQLSVDNGVNYDIALDPGLTFNYTGPSNTGFAINDMQGNKCDNVLSTYVNHSTAIDLQNYIGLTGLRIKFTFFGTAGSSWALDNILIPDVPINEVIEWTDSDGNVVTTGYSTTIKTITPGIQTYGATTLINDCRAPGDEGTELITINASLAYAGENISPVGGECGDNTVSLNAYDNTKSAQQNYDNGLWKLGLYIYPGELYDHDNNVSTPNRIGVNYPGTGEIGEWTVTTVPSSSCGASYSFSNKNSPTSTFTGEVGEYELTWTVAGCSSTVLVTINSCATIDFDGNNDYVTFYDNYDFTGPFSIEAWVKPESITGTQSIFSKRDANNLNDGYDLSLNGGVVNFNWNNGASISSSPFVIGTDRWYHIAITFNGSTYKMFIDGIEIKSVNGLLPISNGVECLLGAMVDTSSLPNNTNNHFEGWMDEFRIWNKAIDVQHLRQMMNQEIKLSGSDDVMGEVIPIKVSGPDNDLNGTDDDILLWSHLQGYYRFDVGCGYLTAYKGLNGRLRNIDLLQTQNAPIPYTTKSGGSGTWDDPATWTESVWSIPNTKGVDDATWIDWNIVVTSHDITADRNITLLGLISQSGELTIDGITGADGTGTGQGLWITHYLKLDGSIDLQGESQLVQKRYEYTPAQFSESIFDEDSGGYIERDQQGQKNSFNYNYWSSPVSPQGGATNNAPYAVGDILNDGTNSASPISITFGDGAYFADFANTGSIKISNRWIWSYNDLINGDVWANYYQWNYIGSTVSIKAGEGFTMKGTGGTAGVTTMQNYVFVGKPHSGDITNLVMTPQRTYLIGNPYPSALDANEFILDNLSGRGDGVNVFNGALYFWDHFRITDNHILAQYAGGYATYTLIGGVPAKSNTPLSVNDGVSGFKKPERYIPVGQAFFVEGTDPDLTGPITVDGGILVFKNSQRVFKPEVVTGLNNGSVFLKSNTKTKVKEKETDVVTYARIRLVFDSPEGYHRQLLAGVDPNTTNQFDIGFDGPLSEDSKEDMFWQLGKDKLVIQGVNNFDADQELPLGLKIAKAGLASIKIEDVKNIAENTTLHIKDKFTGKTHNISHRPFEIELAAGTYLDRFALIFKYQKLMADDLGADILIVEPIIEDNNYHVFMNNTIEELQIKNNGADEIRSISLYNYLGQTMNTWNTNLNRRIISLPAKLATGVYVVQISTIKGIVNKRIIIE